MRENNELVILASVCVSASYHHWLSYIVDLHVHKNSKVCSQETILYFSEPLVSTTWRSMDTYVFVLEYANR